MLIFIKMEVIINKMIDYKKLGFKCGLEIHQQLDGKKLFCSCPCITNKSAEPDFKITRKLRAVAGEKGEKDVAALYEESRDREFIYEVYRDCNCLVELDCEPPHEVNKDALKTALTVALLLNARIEKNIKFMRKIVVDGSNTTGFQRTALIARNGFIETSKGRVRIDTIFLEEEAAKKIKEEGDRVIYRLDRLGIPLIEIATAPDIVDSEHAKESASIIGMILRSVDGIKRGLGTIRQDVNLSINGKPRIEIKGFQELKSISRVIEIEVERQLKTKNLKSEVRNAKKDGSSEFLRPLPGEARMYPETDVPEIIIDNKLLKSIKLPELKIEKSVKLEEKYRLREDLAREIIDEDIDFEGYVKRFENVKPEFIAKVLVDMRKEIKTRFDLETKPDEILEYLNEGKISEINFFELLVEKAQGKKINLEKYKQPGDLDSEIKKIIRENKNASFNAIMGEVMKKFRGKADPKNVAELIKREV
mgnify:CR=1 FL=1